MVRYEWDVETCEDDGTDDPQIIEHWHQPSFGDAVAMQRVLPHPGELARIVLVVDRTIRGQWMTDRGWAYLRPDGTLPEQFEGCEYPHRVPQRFHAEVSRHLTTATVARNVPCTPSTTGDTV